MSTTAKTEFPCALTISVPLPTHRLASYALQALSVDAELSPLVRRCFFLTTPDSSNTSTQSDYAARLNGDAFLPVATDAAGANEQTSILRTEYKATTNRMLRIAVNGFMESLGVILGVMEELDIDVLAEDI